MIHRQRNRKCQMKTIGGKSKDCISWADGPFLRESVESAGDESMSHIKCMIDTCHFLHYTRFQV